MTHLKLGLLMMFGLVACDEPDGPWVCRDTFRAQVNPRSPHICIDPDARLIDPGHCSPLTQSGCNAGEKCTWINDQDNPPIGHPGCAPDPGPNGIPIGSACTDGPAGPMGYDTCVEGAVCLGGECKQICDPSGGVPTCDQNHACTVYADFFSAGGTAIAGVCDPGCDPLTQDLKIGTTTAACGSTMATMPTKGCYGYDDYSCAPAVQSVYTLTDRMAPLTNASGNPYLNGCAPGFIPFFYEMTGDEVHGLLRRTRGRQHDDRRPHTCAARGRRRDGHWQAADDCEAAG